MTKEELEKEAEGYTNKLLEDWELYDPEALQEAYLAGAEPREKHIADLERENARLKEKLEKETAQRIYNLNKSIEWKEKHRELEKENTELKKQLEQAKKYLKECVYNVVSPKRLRNDIEQFLKELAE